EQFISTFVDGKTKAFKQGWDETLRASRVTADYGLFAMHNLQGVTKSAAPTVVQPSAKLTPPEGLAKEVKETTAEIVPITFSDESERMSPLHLPSPTLPMHIGDPSVLDTPIIHPSRDEFGELDEILVNTHHVSSNQVLHSPLNHQHINPTRQIQIRPQKITMSVLLSSPSPSPNNPRAWTRPTLITNPIKGVDHGLVHGQCVLSDQVNHKHHKVLIGKGRRSCRACTSSVKSLDDCDGSGRNSLGCLQLSTGLSNLRTHWEAHDSSDLKTSAFSSGIEWVTLGDKCNRDAATTEIGGGRRDVVVGRWWWWVRMWAREVHAGDVVK
ncbi:unnamed protein product, partial [Ilex paraguariensis]